MTGINNTAIRFNEWATSLDDQKPFYLAIIDKQGRITFTNSRFYTRFLSSWRSAAQNSFFDVIYHADRAQFVHTLDACAAGEGALVTEIRINNSYCRWVKWEISCLKKPDQPEKFLCLGYDIAGEAQLTKARQILSQNYQTIVEDMKVGILVQDAEGVIITANQATAELFHTTLEELYANRVLETPYLQALRTGEVQTDVVLNFEASDGTPHTLLCNSQPLFDESKCMPYSVVSTFQDITKEKAFEKEAQSRATLFSAFMDHSPYFTWIVDEKDQLVFANRTLLDYFHLGALDLGKELMEIIPGPIAATIREMHSRALDCPTQDQRIVKCPMADGREHVYQVIVFPIRDSKGTMIGGEALDITETYNAKQEEIKVSKQLRDLESQLGQQRLKQQKGVAEAIIKAQEDERTRIGHELHDNINQILASGQLYANALNKDREDFDEIKNKTIDILQLAIEEIRVLSRTMVLPDLKKGGLVASINGLADDLRVARLFHICFSHSKTCDIEELSQTKKITLFRIVQEQTKNILNYSKAERVDIALHIDNDRVRLEIKDDGVGFDPENTPRGLGLSNIYERTELYEGVVKLNTAPGKGCSLTVSIPRDVH